MVGQLRSIHPSANIGVASVNGGPVYDQRLPKKSNWGPFATIRELHSDLCNGIDRVTDGATQTAFPGLDELCSFYSQPWPCPVFTHGDLRSFNIIAQGDKVIGIIDWATAGWWPPYWEYTSNWHVNLQNSFWQAEVDRFLEPFTDELRMEIIRRKYFGDF